MYKYTIQYAVPATVKTGPEFVKWIKGVVDKGAYDALAEHALSELNSDTCLYYGRWKPSDGIVEVVRVYTTKTIATTSLTKTKELYKSTLAKPIFSKVVPTTEEEYSSINSI